ncbi:hypothetical protein [Parasphingorhabdus sp.]
MTELTPEESRQATPKKMARHTLAWSLPLAVLVLGVVVFYFVF